MCHTPTKTAMWEDIEMDEDEREDEGYTGPDHWFEINDGISITFTPTGEFPPENDDLPF